MITIEIIAIAVALVAFGVSFVLSRKIDKRLDQINKGIDELFMRKRN